jgi:hypothetical protein
MTKAREIPAFFLRTVRGPALPPTMRYVSEWVDGVEKGLVIIGKP